ncbi:hypothetical protein [Lentzea sp. E54]|uniref:hypothetical protein n=1 Tax=Lentzea xerophila TaxID=3435883 RepID=UPI003DA40E99
MTALIKDAGTIAGDVHPIGAKDDVVVLSAELPGDPLGDQAQDAVTALRADIEGEYTLGVSTP